MLAEKFADDTCEVGAEGEGPSGSWCSDKAGYRYSVEIRHERFWALTCYLGDGRVETTILVSGSGFGLFWMQMQASL